MKKLSVIIAFHQYKNYLKECLSALTDSSFHDFEVVLVKDHCNENIDDLIEEAKTKLDMKVITVTQGSGVSAARNAGIAHSEGQYIYFLDSDDYVLEDSFTQLFAGLTQEVDIIYGKCHRTWNNKANYLEKRLKKMDELDEEEEQLKEEDRESKVMEFVQANQGSTDEQKLRAIYHLIKKRKGFKTISALGNAYSRTFLQAHQIQFSTDLIYYCDLVFILRCVQEASRFHQAIESIYVKRNHNDPINYPSLTQVEDENRFAIRIASFKMAREVIEPNGLLRYLLDRKIIMYFLRSVAPRLRRSEKPEWRKVYFPLICGVIKDCRPDVVHDLKRWQRKLIHSAQNSDLSKVLKQIRFRLMKIKFKKMMKNKNVFYKLAYYHRYLKQPILDNVILFETFTGKNYSDSPKYIYEYMAQNYGDQFNYVWVLNTKTKPKYGGKVVRRFSFRYAYYLARAKYLVFNARQPLWYRKREGQVFLETWHGTPLKRLVFDQEEVTAASPKYKKEFYKQRQDWDYLLSDNDFSTETLKRCFLFENEMLDYGYPRNDVLYREDKEAFAKTLKQSLHIPLDKKTILYAPTWRDDEYYGKGQYKFTLQLDLHLLRERLGEEYVILLRTHQYIADALDVSGLEGFAYNVSTYDDISELYLISDICITDYSSVFFDFANLRRPILFYTYDIEKYKNQLRGFYIDMQSEVPGPLLYTSEEVVDAILHIDEVNANYKERYDAFYNRFCHLSDGHASQRVCEKVFLKK